MSNYTCGCERHTHNVKYQLKIYSTMKDYINATNAVSSQQKTPNGIIQRGLQVQNISAVKRVWINIKKKINNNKSFGKVVGFAKGYKSKLE